MLEVIVVHCHLVLATLLHQILAVLPELVVVRVMQLENILERLQVEVLEAVQVAVLHHYLQDQAQLTHSLTQGPHPLVEQLTELQIKL